MAHPFEKMFSEALEESDESNNLVLEKAEDLAERGYAGKEIAQVLQNYSRGLIDPTEAKIVHAAYVEFEHYLQ